MTRVGTWNAVNDSYADLLISAHGHHSFETVRFFDGIGFCDFANCNMDLTTQPYLIAGNARSNAMIHISRFLHWATG